MPRSRFAMSVFRVKGLHMQTYTYIHAYIHTYLMLHTLRAYMHTCTSHMFALHTDIKT